LNHSENNEIFVGGCFFWPHPVHTKSLHMLLNTITLYKCFHYSMFSWFIHSVPTWHVAL